MTEVTPAVSETDRPAVIFDVDGVLRVDTETKPDGYVRHPIYPMFSYNPGLREPLGNLLAGADGYYISGWREHCHQHIGEVMLLPELDWINDDGFPAQAGEVSERALAIQSLFGNRPVAWLDDELNDQDIRWGEQRSERLAPTLTLRPRFQTGLTPRQVGLVHSWLALL